MKEHKDNDDVECSPTLEVLMASIYYLMTRYVRLPDASVSQAIVEHLEMLEAHPNCDSEILRNAGKRLARQWNEHLHHSNCIETSFDHCMPVSQHNKLH